MKIRKKQIKIRDIRDRKQAGFSLVEMLVVMIILLLSTAAVSNGMKTAIKLYNQNMTQSESKILCSTLANIIENELTYTGHIELGKKVSETSEIYELDKFFSHNYAIEKEYSHFYSVDVDDNNVMTEAEDGFGELALGTKEGDEIIGNLLVSSESYSSYNLKAKVYVVYNKEAKLFHVILNVKGPQDISQEKRFDVLPINNLET